MEICLEIHAPLLISNPSTSPVVHIRTRGLLVMTSLYHVSIVPLNVYVDHIELFFYT